MVPSPDLLVPRPDVGRFVLDLEPVEVLKVSKIARQLLGFRGIVALRGCHQATAEGRSPVSGEKTVKEDFLGIYSWRRLTFSRRIRIQAARSKLTRLVGVGSGTVDSYAL